MATTTPPARSTHPVPPRWARALVRPIAGRPALLLELFIFLMFFQYFNFAQGHIRGGEVESIRHAHHLYSLERTLHLDMELWFNSHLAGIRPLAIAAGYFYGMVLATVPITLAWCWWFNAPGYRRLRRLLVAVTLPSLLVFWLLPMAPPRFAVDGIHDINAIYNILGGALARDPSKSANLYAAMPSLHIAWSTWVGYTIFQTLRRRHPRAAWAAWGFPLVTAWDVMATGNHFFLDILGGLALVLLGLAAVRLWEAGEGRVWSSEGITPAAYEEPRPGG